MKKMKLISMYKNYGTEDAYDDNSEVYAITDNYVCDEKYKDIPTNKKVALMIEPRSFLPNGYEYLQTHYNEYKYIFTFDDILLKLPNALPIVYGTYWCTSDEEKTKGISMICSAKEGCEGHRERKRLAKILSEQGIVDVMGAWNGGDYVPPIKAFKDYKFNIALENDKQDYYFTEKLCNCFANKVIPIYYGARKLDEFFDTRGIIYVEDKNTIPQLIDNLDIDKEYEKRKEYIDKNYELVKQYQSFDDYFYNKYGNLIEEMFD